MRRRRDNVSPTTAFHGVGTPLLRLRRAILTIVAVLAAGASLPARAQDAIDAQREYNVKAVSLYAFGRYVTWPESVYQSKDSPVVIGVFGANPFGDALEHIAAKKTLHGRPIAVRQLSSPEEIAACHLVFVPRSVTRDVESKLFQVANGKPVLLVGETPGFTQRGGVINFFQNGANIRFELNAERGTASKLSLDAKLLSLGTKAENRDASQKSID